MKVSGIILTNGLAVVPCFFEKLEKQEITLGARCTYGVLAKLSGKSDKCWPSQKYLAERLGVSIRSIQKYLRELARLGFIAILSGHDGETNTYQLLPHPLVISELEGRAACSSATPAKFSEGDGEKISPVFKKEEKKNTPLTPQRGEEGDRLSQSTRAWKLEAIAAFDRVWAVWPVQEARKAALRRWLRLWRLRILPPLESILASVRAHMARNPRWQRGFVPFLVTWLKDRRWEDDLPAPEATARESQSKAVLRQGEETKAADVAAAESALPHAGTGEPRNVVLSHSAQQQLDAAVAIWPKQVPDSQTSMLRGLWLHLYRNNSLPSLSAICRAAKSATTTLPKWLHERWLHDFRQDEFSLAV